VEAAQQLPQALELALAPRQELKAQVESNQAPLLPWLGLELRSTDSLAEEQPERSNRRSSAPGPVPVPSCIHQQRELRKELRLL